jgi:uncharacterized protein (TIGR03067 family)
MKRFLVLLLVMGVLVAADRSRYALALDDKDKKEEKKEDKDKKADDKDKDKDKDKGKKEEEKPPTEEQKKELEKISGTFTVTLFERDGKKYGADELKKMKVVQKGAEWSFHLGDDITQGKDTVFPDKNPKEINSLYLNGPAKDKTVLGIYKIEGDSVTYCWAEPGKERPKEFATKADSGLTLMTLKIAKGDGEAKDKDKKEEKDKDKKEEKDKDKKEEKKDKDK